MQMSLPRYWTSKNCFSSAFTSDASRKKSLASAPRVVETKPAEDVRQRLVTFEVAGQEYALNLDVVREIVPAPEELTSIPGSDEAVRGVMAYRELDYCPCFRCGRCSDFRPGLNCAKKFWSRPLGVCRSGWSLTEPVRSFRSIPTQIEPTPSVLNARAGGETQIKAIYRAENGRLISILAPEQLFREEVMQRLTQDGAPDEVESHGYVPRHCKSRNCGFWFFALAMMNSRCRSTRSTKSRAFPSKSPDCRKHRNFSKVSSTLRGDVLPVVDQRRRFDMPAREGNADRRLVVVRTERHRAGLIVDSVSEVLRCGSQSLKPAPDLTGEALALVRSVINLESAGRIVLLLDPSELLSRAERGLLDTFTKDMRGKKPRQA